MNQAMTTDQPERQPIAAIDSFLSNAMGANSLAARMDAAFMLETCLRNGGDIGMLGLAEPGTGAIEALSADYQRDPQIFGAYFAALKKSQSMIQTFARLDTHELIVIRTLLDYADKHGIATVNDLFDHRLWLNMQPGRQRYTLPTGKRKTRNKPDVTPETARIVLSFMNIPIPDIKTASVNVGGRVSTQSWAIAKFDKHAAGRRAAMKDDDALQARGLFFSWLGKATPALARIVMGHRFYEHRMIALDEKENTALVAEKTQMFIESCAIRDAVAQCGYIAPVQEQVPVVEQAAEHITMDQLAEECAKAVPSKKPAINLSAPLLPGQLPTLDDIMPIVHREPIKRRIRAPYLGGAERVWPESPAYVPSRFMKNMGRMAKAACIAFAFYAGYHYEPTRALGEKGVESAKTYFANVTGQAQREQAARELAARIKPEPVHKIQDRLAGHGVFPAFKGSAAGETVAGHPDLDRPKPVKTYRVPGDGIDRLVPR